MRRRDGAVRAGGPQKGGRDDAAAFGQGTGEHGVLVRGVIKYRLCGGGKTGQDLRIVESLFHS